MGLPRTRIAELFAEAGLPPGVLQCVTGPGGSLGNELISHPKVRRVALTGSSQTGERVMQVAGLHGGRAELVERDGGGSVAVLLVS
jgi:acyl-CoA reductase-like NAD-dependent aldehyde dehydrogenase